MGQTQKLLIPTFLMMHFSKIVFCQIHSLQGKAEIIPMILDFVPKLSSTSQQHFHCHNTASTIVPETTLSTYSYSKVTWQLQMTPVLYRMVPMQLWSIIPRLQMPMQVQPGLTALWGCLGHTIDAKDEYKAESLFRANCLSSPSKKCWSPNKPWLFTLFPVNILDQTYQV